MVRNLLIPEPLANAILQYLADQPYKEVAAMIRELTQLQQAPIVKPEVKNDGC